MVRYLRLDEALATVRRGRSIAQLLTYDAGAPPTFRYVWVRSTPRDGIRVGVEHVEDIGDGQQADIGYFPDVTTWEPEFDMSTGRLLNGPDPTDLVFDDVETAVAWLAAEHGSDPGRWRDGSMIGDECLAARRAAQP